MRGAYQSGIVLHKDMIVRVLETRILTRSVGVLCERRIYGKVLLATAHLRPSKEKGLYKESISELQEIVNMSLNDTCVIMGVDANCDLFLDSGFVFDWSLYL